MTLAQMCTVKVPYSYLTTGLDKPLGLHEVEAPRISRQLARESGTLSAPAAFTPQEIFLVISVRDSVDPRTTVRQEGLSHARCTVQTFNLLDAAGLGAPYRCESYGQ